MPASLVRAHTRGAGTAAGTTVAATIATAAVAVGNVLVAWVASRDAKVVGSLSKPGAETATWSKVGGQTNGSEAGELWAIKTTVEWPVGTAVTATFTSSAPRRAILLAEYTGVDAVARGSAGVGSGTGGSTSATVGTGLAGDIVLGGGVGTANNYYDGLAVDADTVAGPWVQADLSVARTGVGDTFALSATLQHKILTASGSQTFNVVTTNSAGGSVASQDVGAVAVALRNTNVAPNAPTLSSPIGGVTIDRANANRFSWVFSDPNAGDSQSAFDLRYRIVGTSTWTDVHGDTPNQFHDIAAGTLAAGNYEWQVRTYDALGAVGPYSASGHFTAADHPDGPTITAPTSGSTVEALEDLVWSTAEQDSYQVRRVADDSGAPDTSTVYFDTGEVVDASTRTRAIAFETNGRAEHLQVRTKADALWSPWSSVAVDVDYTPPPAPVVELAADPSTGSILLTITNPTPVGDEPATAYVDVFIDDGDGEERKATGLPANTPWRYWTPVSGRNYDDAVRVVAYGANGTSTSSE